MSTPGQKKGIFGQEQAKGGQLHCSKRMIGVVFPAAVFLGTGLRVRAGAIDAMSLRNGEPAVRFSQQAARAA